VRVAILARHGETTFNVERLLNGDLGVACPLTETGEQQARRLGEQLAGDRIDLCVTSEFERARRTAELALDGREVPRLVLPELNDPRYGSFEGQLLEDYRAWAGASPSSAAAPGGGESRRAIVARYVRGFRTVLERPEACVLVVSHSLPVAYVLAARAGDPPGPRVPLVDYAYPYRLDAEELERAVALLDGWVAEPTW
jgi:broad specificity phosphatase PhoE